MSFCPLISLKECGHENYFLWIEDIDKTSIMVKVTDGYKVWEEVIRAGTNKPKSRKETDSEYIDLVLSCLQLNDTKNRDYSLSLTAAGKLELKIKERLGSMMALLLNLQLTENYDSTAGIRKILEGACVACANSTNSLSDALKEIQLNREANDSLSQTILSYTKEKEEFQDNFFKKMCIILNLKKSEIRRLHDEISELEDEISCLKANATSSQRKLKAGTKNSKKTKKSSRCSADEEVGQSDDDNDLSGDGYSVNSDDEVTSRGTESDKEDELTEGSHVTVNSNRGKKRHPPSYKVEPAKGLKKKKTQSFTQQSQIISQVLASAPGSTETTDSDLKKMLSQSSPADSLQSNKRGNSRRRRVVETQEDANIDVEDDDKPDTCKYEYDDAQNSEDDEKSDGDKIISADDVPVRANKKAKKSAFDKLYNDDSSSDEGNLMDYI